MNQDEENQLKFHYSNPKFKGLPWPANKYGRKKRERMCVKRPYVTEQEAATEVARLTIEEHKNFFGQLLRWEYGFCSECDAWHVIRLGSA
jgi:hypothetical protein